MRNPVQLTGTSAAVREIRDRVDLDGWRGIACVLGGDDRRTLFLLEAMRTAERKIEGRGNARIRSVRVDVPGVGIP